MTLSMTLSIRYSIHSLLECTKDFTVIAANKRLLNHRTNNDMFKICFEYFKLPISLTFIYNFSFALVYVFHSSLTIHIVLRSSKYSIFKNVRIIHVYV